jgi:uncharacterized protein (TIGR02444 family)
VRERQPCFWAFSLSVYQDEDVQAECLDLQEHHGIDVNMLLFCAYLGAVHGAVLSDAEMRQAAELVADWHEHVVRGLRGARRALKAFATNPSPFVSTAEALRTGVKAMELEAERIEQTMLEQWSTARTAAGPRLEPSAAVAANIQTLFAARDRSFAQPGLPHHLVAAALVAAR